VDPITKGILDSLVCLGANRGTIYVTVPITSGIRQFKLMADLGCRNSSELREKHRARWMAEVKKPNEDDARAYTLMVRILNPDHLVLNPAEIEVDSWSQQQYTEMWDEVLVNFCHTLVVTPDWAFSHGGRLEVQRMLALGRSVVDIFGKPLTKALFEKTDEHAKRQLLEMGLDESQVGEYLPNIVFPKGGIKQPPLFGDTAFDDAVEWIISERTWQNRVSDFPDRERTSKHGTRNENGEWFDLLDKYFQRARTSGFETSEGGCDLLTFVTLAVAMLENVTTLHGPLPEPGVKSDVSPTINQLHSPEMTPNQRLAMAMSWLSREKNYLREKFSQEEDDENTRSGIGTDSWWYRQLKKYWRRAHQHGLDTPDGRRQLGKYTSTAMGLAISRIHIWGVPPHPVRRSADELRERGFFDSPSNSDDERNDEDETD
jgi:hypothetical protein